MSDLVGNHIVGFLMRRLLYALYLLLIQIHITKIIPLMYISLQGRVIQGIMRIFFSIFVCFSN